jgi:hypothetical protein
VHPDGSYGGEYTSRNTYNFFPHGFELVGRWMPESLSINDRFLKGLQNGYGSCYADDHIIGHHTWNYLLAWQDFVDSRPPTQLPASGRIWLPNARILIDQREETKLYLALNKGGSFKFFRNNKLVFSDTQFSLQVQERGKTRNAVGHLVSDYEFDIQADQVTIHGSLGWAKQKKMTPLNLIILRIVMLSVGRFFPNLIRKLLQKMLITGKQDAPFYFQRILQWQNDGWILRDKLIAKKGWENVRSVGIGCDQTSIYVVMSRTFQVGQLQPWKDLTREMHQLPSHRPLEIERYL